MKEGNGTVNVLYGSKSTDIYANATYRYQEGNKDYVTFHMTNRFDDRNRLLTFFTQQFIEQPYNMTRKVMGRARYFHTFNDMGTELLLVGGYQYSSDPRVSNTLPLYIVELNTPLFTKRLSMMVGNEGDYLTRVSSITTSTCSLLIRCHNGGLRLVTAQCSMVIS